MMAKMFYTLEETKAALGKSEDEIKQYAREGRLREFRDGPRLMFKADQVDQLRNDMGAGGRPDLGPSDTGAGIPLAGDIGASGSGVISLADTDFGRSPGAGMAKEDTALAADLGLSGSMGGVPSPGRAGSGGSAAGTRAGGPGITVFDVDDTNRADPLAQTAIGQHGGSSDQVNLEGVGSGSGLLDLTRESDDTSLGAELLDEITPGGTALGGTAMGGSALGGTALGGTGMGATVRRPAVGDSGVAMDQLAAGGGAINRSRLAQPVFVERADPMELGFGLLALAGLIVVLFAGYAVVNAIFGVKPDIVQAAHDKGPLFLGGAAVGALLLFIIGFVAGKGTAR